MREAAGRNAARPRWGAGWARSLARFARQKPLGAIGGVLVLFVVLVAIFAPFVATRDPLFQDAPNRLRPPSAQFFFGTDTFGRDVFSRVVYGARISVYVGMMSVVIGTTLGTGIGIVSAYAGGRLDMTIQRVMDALLGFPSLVIALALVTALGASQNSVAFAIAAGFIPRVSRVVRSQALTVKHEDYVLAAHAIGAQVPRILVRHVLPNCAAPVIVLATGYLGTAIIAEASLSYLGLGVPPPEPSWGGLLYGGTYRYVEGTPWLSIFPGVVLTVTVLGFNVWGDALRDVLDPRMRGT